jgi:hypothetical protein
MKTPRGLTGGLTQHESEDHEHEILITDSQNIPMIRASPGVGMTSDWWRDNHVWE